MRVVASNAGRGFLIEKGIGEMSSTGLLHDDPDGPLTTHTSLWRRMRKPLALVSAGMVMGFVAAGVIAALAGITYCNDKDSDPNNDPAEGCAGGNI
ncbi:MAG TPA: hypothetical protein VMG12_35205, partial [Polyangiaceae bacterium]|nr:hypothetical protein [Polyangiaceae bacterium]